MRKFLFKIYKAILLALMFLIIIIPLFISLYVEDIEYYPYKIESKNQYLKEVTLKTEFDSETKELLNDTAFSKNRKKDINICVLDVFDTKKNKQEDDVYSHGEYVMNMIDKRYDGKITLLPVEHFTFLNTPIEQWNNCDVINYSMGINADDMDSSFDKQFIKFINQYEGIMVVSAGNEGNTNQSSQWAYIKEKHPDLKTNNLLIVTQGDIEKTKDGDKPVIKTSYGEMVDLVVFNYGELLYGKKQFGSSFASPVVSSVIGNLLASGLSKEKVMNKINQLDDITIGEYDYKNFDITKMYE